jgi:hypothetical protein
MSTVVIFGNIKKHTNTIPLRVKVWPGKTVQYSFIEVSEPHMSDKTIVSFSCFNLVT